ncbi:haloacid dehalogenase-like hydrolase [Microbulbifer thermotolerans]|uniref:HAD family hydrolase n=1 Tax=Microbulbifer thermotolerans TaxID=252514 RepID=UPI00224B90CE|nr:HAD family hydrolase [Microbulbifer thermotolerans]MCX2781863.1 haloacid dehalogenase-like hydrolase [Microbulbifer thermotolerans]
MRAYRHSVLLSLLMASTTLILSNTLHAAADPLPSWNEGPTKQAITAFVNRTTNQSSPDFIPQEHRIATFDNDGTLWPSHPMYTQLAFAIERIKAMAPQHPEWKTKQPFKAVLENDMDTLASSGEEGVAQLVMASHAGMSTAEFEAIVTEWFKTAQHPRFKKRYTQLAYQPMIELFKYLRHNGFKTYIVSGGGIEFMRPMTQAVYGIPPEQVIGSSIEIKYELQQGKPVLMRQAKIDFISDKAGKPVAINRFIGKRPVVAIGNSDGDRQMLEWTDAVSKSSLKMLVLHDDAKREYAYGPAEGLPDTKFGAFSESLYKTAKKRNWIVISMKRDWKRIFSFDSAEQLGTQNTGAKTFSTNE